MQAGADGSYRCANRASNLLNGEIAVKAKDDNDALVGTEAAERAVEGVAVVDLAMGVMWGSRRSCSIQIPVASVAATPEVIAADVDQDSSEPCVEALRIAEPMVIPPCSDECVVGRILCLLCVTEDETSEPVGRIEPLVDETLEGGGSGRLRVCRDDSGFLAQTGLSFREHPRPLPVSTHQGSETFILRRHAPR